MTNTPTTSNTIFLRVPYQSPPADDLHQKEAHHRNSHHIHHQILKKHHLLAHLMTAVLFSEDITFFLL